MIATMRASSSHELEFGSRFTIRREIGRGGMGIVYAAHDRERGFEVALKRLRELEPTSLYRFKREFRALADVIHPNLVTLYELLCDHDQWFFTMELVEGVDFVDYVRGDDPAPHVLGRRPDATTRVTGNTPSRDATVEGRTLPVASSFDPERLRSGFRQLADGLCALHRSGHLHRDIKPSNVLVTPAGRVVILDFGVIAELRGRGYEPAAVGTPLYMAPEQVDPGATLSEATDWYGAGVVLYQALTGRRPFEGDATAVLRAKQEREPLPPRARVSDVPADLDELCAGLLRTRADQRPSGAEVLARLCGNAPQTPASVARTPALIGRDVHRDVLHDGFAAAKGGQGQILLVHGRSGIGKSELVHRFLAELEAAGALVLSGRCFERESVPFKGVDSLIDSLASHLLGLPRPVADAGRTLVSGNRTVKRR